MHTTILRSLTALILLLALTLPVLGLDKEVYMAKSNQELLRLHQEKYDKAQELYKLEQFKECLTYLEEANFIANVLIEKANLRMRARRKLEEARKLVGEAKNKL